MSSILIEYCSSWGYKNTAEALQKHLQDKVALKVNVAAAKGKTSRIDIFLVDGEKSNGFGCYVEK